MCDRKAVIKNADMSEEMQQDAVDCATQALEKFNIEKVSLVDQFSFFFPALLGVIFKVIFVPVSIWSTALKILKFIKLWVNIS